MSKSDDITRIKLGAIQGAFLVFKKENRFARMDIKRAVNDGFVAVENFAMVLAPCRLMANDRYVSDKWGQFSDFVLSEPNRDFQDSAVFAYMCSRLVGDLIDEFGHNPRKMAYIAPISDAIDMILDFCDPTGKNRVAYGTAKRWLNHLDEILGLEMV